MMRQNRLFCSMLNVQRGFFKMANVYKNSKLDLTTTDVTTLYTCPAATTAVFKSILVSEDSGNADTVTATITVGSTIFSLFKVKAVGANTTVELLTQPLVMLPENSWTKRQRYS